MDSSALQAFYETALKAAAPHLTSEAIKSTAQKGALRVQRYAAAHPYSSATMAISLGLAPFLGAGWMTAGLLRVIGFGPLGPVAGGVASWYQATWLGGYIPAGSIFAWCQHMAMGA